MSEEPFTRINSKVLDINLSVKEFRKATSVCVCVLLQNVSTWYFGIPGQLSDDDKQAQSWAMMQDSAERPPLSSALK